MLFRSIVFRVLAFTGFFFMACNGAGAGSHGSQSIPDSTEKEIELNLYPRRTDRYKQGEVVVIKRNYLENADSVVLWVDGIYQGQMDTVFDYQTTINHRVGYIPYKMEVYSEGDKSSANGIFLLMPLIPAKTQSVEIIRTYPHDRSAYTQGLFWHEGYLYEGTGLEGKSTLRKVNLQDGYVLKKIDISRELFGEGITLVNDKIYQLTWKHGKGFVYDSETFEKTDEFGYAGEGWGLTTDGQLLYMSNGTNRIKVIDPEDFRTVRTIEVYSHAGPVNLLNELEWIEGEIWANVYMSDNIVKIDPVTGVINSVLDLKGLLQPQDITNETDVLNGIAFDSEAGRIFVTGKNWNKLFEIVVVGR